MYKSYVNLFSCTLEICADEEAVFAVRRVNKPEQAKENRLTKQAAEELLAYARKERKTFTFPIRTSGTEFQKAVWEELKKIPYGKTVCYGEIASALGKPNAVRAVGGAIGKNPVLIAVPCHRVVGKNGTLTGFAGGLELKRALLELEK